MRVSSQSQHSESWIFRHFGIHPRELAVESEGGRRRACARKKESERRELKERKGVEQDGGAKAATQKCRGMECKMVHVHPIHPPFFVLHRVSPPLRLFFRPVSSSSHLRALSSRRRWRQPRIDRGMKSAMLPLWPVESRGLSAFSIRHHPCHRRRPIFRLIPFSSSRFCL